MMKALNLGFVGFRNVIYYERPCDGQGGHHSTFFTKFQHRNGDTALMHAAGKGHIEVSQMLVEAGAATDTAESGTTFIQHVRHYLDSHTLLRD